MAPKRKSSDYSNRLSSKKPRAVQVNVTSSPIESSQRSPPLARRERQSNPLFPGSNVTPQSPLPVISAANERALPEYIKHYQNLCQKDELPTHILQDLKRSYTFFKHQLSSEAFEHRVNPALVKEWIQVCEQFRDKHGIGLLDCLSRKWEELSRVATSGYADQDWATEVEELINTTNQLSPSVPSSCSASKWASLTPFFLTDQDRKKAIEDVEKLKRLAGLQSHNIKSGFDYVYYPFPETRAHEVAASEQITREMKEPGILSDGAKVEYVINRPPYHARLPHAVAYQRRFRLVGVASRLVRSMLSWDKQKPRQRPAALARTHLTPRPDPKKSLQQLAPVRDARHRISKVAPPPRNAPRLRGGGRKDDFGSSSSTSKHAPGYRESRKQVDSDDESSSDGGPRAPTRVDPESPELLQVGPGYQGNYRSSEHDTSDSDLEPATGVPGVPIAGAQDNADGETSTAVPPNDFYSEASEEEYQSGENPEAISRIKSEDLTESDGFGDEMPLGEADQEAHSSGSSEDIFQSEVKQESLSPTAPNQPIEMSGAVALNDDVGSHLRTTQRPHATYAVNELGSPIQLAPVDRPRSFVRNAYPSVRATDWSSSSTDSALPSEAATRRALGDITDQFGHEENRDEDTSMDDDDNDEDDDDDEWPSPDDKENRGPIAPTQNPPDGSLADPAVISGQEAGPCHPCPKYKGLFHHRCNCEGIPKESVEGSRPPENPVPSPAPVAGETRSARAVRHSRELRRYVVGPPAGQAVEHESTELGAHGIEDRARWLILYALDNDRFLNGGVTPFEGPNSRYFRRPNPNHENEGWYSYLMRWATVLADFEDPDGHTSIGVARSAAQHLATHMSTLRTHFYGDENNLYSLRILRSYATRLADLYPTIQDRLYFDEEEGRVIEDPEAIADTAIAGAIPTVSGPEAAQSTAPAHHTEDKVTHAQIVQMRTLVDRLRQYFGLGLPTELSGVRSFSAFRRPSPVGIDTLSGVRRNQYDTLNRAVDAVQRIADRLRSELPPAPDDVPTRQDLQLAAGGLIVIQSRYYGTVRNTPKAGEGGSDFDYNAYERTPRLSPLHTSPSSSAQAPPNTTHASPSGSHTTPAAATTRPTLEAYTTWMFGYEMREELQHRGVPLPTGNIRVAGLAQMLVDADSMTPPNLGRGNRHSYRLNENKPGARGKPQGYQYPAGC